MQDMARPVMVERHPNIHDLPEVGVPIPVLRQDLYHLEERAPMVGTSGFRDDAVEFPGNVEVLEGPA